MGTRHTDDEDTSRSDTGAAVRGDGRVEITIDEDVMSARALLTPASPGGRPVTRGYIEQLLLREGVSHGIDWPLVDTAVEACDSYVPGAERPGEVVIARGTPPVARVRSHFTLHPSFAAIRELIEKASVDPAAALRHSRSLPVAFAGQTLAVLEDERPGVPGTNVRGETVPFEDAPVVSLSAGRNTRLEGDRIVAAQSGLLRISKGELLVERNLALNCNVDNSTGDISFPGNLALSGTVADGYRLWVGGDLHAQEALDAHEVFCRGELAAAGGIIGKKRALVRCRGKVRAKFVESCTVESKSSVFVESFCYNARIMCLDRLVMGQHGKIVGGEVRSAHGVSADEIGNRAEVATRVAVGSDFITARKLVDTKRKIESLQASIVRVDRRLAERADRPSASLRNRRLRLVEKLDGYTVILENLVKNLDRNEQATVVARSAVYPGTVIEICRAIYAVEEAMGPSVFRLDIPAGRIVVETPSGEVDGELEAHA
ncbi:MAG: DUF342 domain-containing protein [Spirochaetota bacterium]